ncbi:MAG: tryptophan 7-halogenase [Xanthomonadales bacterium]|nr:tryptophan 7-halogenase [Xanthomonadales bacterium]
MSDSIKRKIVVLGATVEGYMAAWTLKQQYAKGRFDITVLDCATEGGEGAFSLQEESLRILARFGLNEKTLLENVSGTHKLGTTFGNWRADGGEIVQPLGTHGGPMESVAFQNFAVVKRREHGGLDYNDYSLSANAAQAGKFIHPQINPGSILSTLGYSLHLDRSELRALLEKLCREEDVATLDSEVQEVGLSEDGSSVARLTLSDGKALDADLFIDCSNRADSPVGDALSVPFESWRRYFANDRKIAFRQQGDGNCRPLTEVTAYENGLIRKVPLETSFRGELYYPGERLDREHAVDFLKSVEPGAEIESDAIAFESGIRASAWVGNYVALGKAYGRYEPLDSSNFHGFLVSLERFLDLFPRTADCECEAREFNRKTRLWFENLRDHNLMRYVSLQFSSIEPDGLEALPESFRQKFRLFTETADVAYFEEEPFGEPYRVSCYINMGFWPKSHHVLVDRFDFGKLDQRFEEFRRMVDAAVAKMPNHLEYTRRLLASQ